MDHHNSSQSNLNSNFENENFDENHHEVIYDHDDLNNHNEEVDGLELVLNDLTEQCERAQRQNDISKWQILAYSIGHFYNDLCSSMWFTYLMIYLEKVVNLNSSLAGLLMLIGQVSY